MEIFNLKNVEFSTEEEIRAKIEKENREKRTQELLRIVPATFKYTEHHRLDSHALAEALAWATNPIQQPLNLLLSGNTGVGKTRIAWEAIKTRFLTHGHRPIAIGAESFARRINDDKSLLEKLSYAKLLLLDDLGKERTTPTAESAIFELVRERTDNLHSTIYTTNFTPKTLMEKFIQKETGQAVCRRLMEDSLILPINQATK